MIMAYSDTYYRKDECTTIEYFKITRSKKMPQGGGCSFSYRLDYTIQEGLEGLIYNEIDCTGYRCTGGVYSCSV